MKRLCIFAHWSKDNLVDEYVIYYLKSLKEVCEYLIFVSDCNLEEKEIGKIKEITEFIIAKKHGEYDFGSYKKGFQFALEKKLEFEELIFANDSCYGPFFSLKPIFEKMEKKKNDFWGLTQNRYGIQKTNSGINKPVIIPHVQSYFIAFKRNIFQDTDFIDFMNNVTSEVTKDDVIIKYELGLSQLLYSKGYKSSVFINKYRYVHNYTGGKWDKLILNYGFPFLKTTIVKNGFYFSGEVKNWDKCIQKKSDYPIELIKSHSKKYLDLQENLYEKTNIYRKIRFNLLKDLPLGIRYCVIFFEKNMFNILNRLCFNKLKKF